MCSTKTLSGINTGIERQKKHKHLSTKLNGEHLKSSSDLDLQFLQHAGDCAIYVKTLHYSKSYTEPPKEQTRQCRLAQYEKYNQPL